MNYLLQYNPAALSDLNEVLTFLAKIDPSLPRKFRTLLAEKFTELDQNPERWSPLSKGIRAIRIKLSRRLSYYCFYHFYEEEKRILVLRILSQFSDPKNWPEE